MYIVGMNWPDFKGSMAVIYAPIAGISDSPSRQIARTMGADITVSELISAEGVIRKCPKTMKLAYFDSRERPIGIQLFGANPRSMAEAARIMEDRLPDFIDINFGCPARKIVEKNGGSSVLRNLKLFKTITETVTASISLPVTVKIRSGWDDDSLVFEEAGKIAEDCGVAAVTLHPRTKIQGFSGKADWSHIRRLKEKLKIPVIGNGDILAPQDAFDMFEQTGCDAVMIGRGSLGNPWIFKRIKDFRETGIMPPQPSPRDKIKMALQHFESTLEYYGLPRGIYIMRSRFAWYIRGLPEASKMRARINMLESPGEIRTLLLQYASEPVSNWNAAANVAN